MYFSPHQIGVAGAVTDLAHRYACANPENAALPGNSPTIGIFIASATGGVNVARWPQFCGPWAIAPSSNEGTGGPARRKVGLAEPVAGVVVRAALVIPVATDVDTELELES